MRIKIEACCGKGLNKKPGTILGFRVLIKIFRQRPTLPLSLPSSTIGAEELNFRVRDGNGCFLFAIATEKTLISCQKLLLRPFRYKHIKTFNHLCQNCGQTSRPISTRKLNISLCLHIGPINLVIYKGSLVPVFPPEGISNLEVGFPLRCFQRLSIPNLATQQCRWHDNWNTIGSSIPVLSY